ncbi:MAG: pilus assembly protein PilM [Alphaproteobacteria bacterium]|nr:pilus assembly protein PilM [Alphaproteobacteria bacterium]
MARLIAMDIGSHAIKVATYKVAGRGPVELDKRYTQIVPQDGVPPTLEHRLAALDALLDDSPRLKPQSSDVVVLSWPSHEAAFHRVAMPFSDKAQIERTLPFAVENEVPFELDDMVLSWRTAEQGEQTQVLTVLARRERVQEWLGALGERGIDPASIHVVGDLFGPMGTAPIQPFGDDGLPGVGKTPLVAVIDIGHLHTTISVVRDQAVQYARSVNVAGHAFTRAIQQGMGCTWEEAERLKHGGATTGLVLEDEAITDIGNTPAAKSGYAALPQPARQQIDAAIGLLLAEIRSTLIKAEDQLGGEIVEVRVCGGSTAIDELLDYLHADLGVPVHELADARGQPIPPIYAVTHGLAVATSGPSNPVDLRVGALAYKGRTDILRAALGYGVAGAFVFSLALTLLFAVRYRGLVVELHATEGAVREIVATAFPEVPEHLLETMDQASAVMAQNTADAVQRAEVLGDGSNGVPPTVDALYQLTQAFPPHPDVEVELSDLTITKAAISFNAEAVGGYASSATVETTLKQNPRFHAATKGQETRLASGAVRFPITIPLDGSTVDDEG